MKDRAPVPPGTQGTVVAVTPFLPHYHIEMKWDNGSTLALLSDVDQWIVRG